MYCHLLSARRGSERVTWVTARWGFVISIPRWGGGCSEKVVTYPRTHSTRQSQDLNRIYLFQYLARGHCWYPWGLVAQLGKWNWVVSESSCRKMSCLQFRWTGSKAHPVFSSGGSWGGGWQRGSWEEEADAIWELATGGWPTCARSHPLGLRAVAGPWASGLSGHRGPSTCSRTRLGAGELRSIFSHCWRGFVRKSRHKTQLSSSSKRDTGTSRSPEWTVCRKLQLGGRLRAAGLSWVHPSFKGFCRPYQPTGLSLRCPAFSRCGIGGEEGRMH